MSGLQVYIPPHSTPQIQILYKAFSQLSFYLDFTYVHLMAMYGVYTRICITLEFSNLIPSCVSDLISLMVGHALTLLLLTKLSNGQVFNVKKDVSSSHSLIQYGRITLK